MTNAVYEMPREKLARKGVASLTNAELLQVIIGSGNAQVSVAKIAKKVTKVLAKSGSAVHPQELLVIQGVGKVKAGQILALFELASRFPILAQSQAFDSKDSLKVLYQELTAASVQTVIYATFDGAGRLISKRQFLVEATHTGSSSAATARQLRRLFADCIADSAVSIMITVGWANQPLEPQLFELNLVRNINKTAQLLSLPIRYIGLVSQQGEYSMKGELT
ncbi:MAG: UPF0758 domain-containing protein [Candidatus Microsaccharimonas sp.]